MEERLAEARHRREERTQRRQRVQRRQRAHPLSAAESFRAVDALVKHTDAEGAGAGSGAGASCGASGCGRSGSGSGSGTSDGAYLDPAAIEEGGKVAGGSGDESDVYLDNEGSFVGACPGAGAGVGVGADAASHSVTYRCIIGLRCRHARILRGSGPPKGYHSEGESDVPNVHPELQILRPKSERAAEFAALAAKAFAALAAENAAAEEEENVADKDSEGNDNGNDNALDDNNNDDVDNEGEEPALAPARRFAQVLCCWRSSCRRHHLGQRLKTCASVLSEICSRKLTGAMWTHIVAALSPNAAG